MNDVRVLNFSPNYAWGRMICHTGPNGYVQNYTYSDTDSKLMKITDKNGKFLWRYVEDIPGIKQKYTLGNSIACSTISSEDETQRTLDFTNSLAPITRHTYQLDPLLGNVTSRKEQYKNITYLENFTYDPMDRLTDVQGSSEMHLLYDKTGNIIEKTGVGLYHYESGRTHAVSQIESNSKELSEKPGQQITYTEFNKIEYIREGEYEMQFYYGPDEQRVKSMLVRNGDIERIVYYGNGFDLVIDKDGKETEHSYLGGDGSFGVAIRDALSGTETNYYFLCDLLGSITAVTDRNGNVVEKRSYDAWGRQRNPLDWNDYKNVPQMKITRLGYTFQEEMPEFGLINLNGRLYDPMLGRMLSPDPFIQDPGNSQNYNRYSYCWNNPMKYTDPSGNFILGFFYPGIGSVVDAMLWSGLTYSIQAKGQWEVRDFFGSMFKSGLLSAISMGMSGAIGDALGHAVGNLGTEALRAGLHGMVGGILGTASGSSFLDGFASGAISSLTGSGMQALNISNPALLGLGGAISGGATAALTGGDLGTAAFHGFMVGMFNHGAGADDPPNKWGFYIINGSVQLGEVTVTAPDLSQFKKYAADLALIALNLEKFDLRTYGTGSNQTDCSFTTQESQAKIGFKIPRTVELQKAWFQKNAHYYTDPSKIQPGDQLFYSNPNHTGIAVKKNGVLGIIHATTGGRIRKSIIFSPIDKYGHILNQRSRSRTGWPHIFNGFGRH